MTTTQITETRRLAKQAARKGDITILGNWSMGERYLLVDFAGLTVRAVEAGAVGEATKLWTSARDFMDSCMRDSGYRVVV